MATSILFRAGPERRRRASIGPGTLDSQGLEEIEDDFSPAETPTTRRNDSVEHASYGGRGRLAVRAARRISADSSIFERIPLAYHEQSYEPPIPPYSASVTPQSSTTPLMTPTLTPNHSTLHLPTVNEDPAQVLEAFRNVLRADLSADGRSMLST